MILVQSNSERTLAHHFDAACALYGAIESGENYRLTSFEEIQSGKMDMMLRINTSCAVGSTEFMREVFKRLGKDDVRLPRNSNRSSEIITLAEAHQRVAAGSKIFIKPVVAKQYGISGLVLDGAKYTILNDVPDDTKFYAYQPFTGRLESEWRIYVHKNQMIDARNYSGNFCLMFNSRYVQSVIEENKKDFPVAYTIDIGLLKKENTTYLDKKHGHINYENVVVEYNDMWAIGNYGIPNDLYLRLLKDRYFEILNESN
jgi:hypothetical protein